jgi:hypothetical protein
MTKEPGTSFRTAQAHNTTQLDVTNAAILEDLLLYLALCERDPNTPSVMAFDGSILIPDSHTWKETVSGLNRQKLRQLAVRVENWNGKFAVLPDGPSRESGCRYELVRAWENRNPLVSHLLQGRDDPTGEMKPCDCAVGVSICWINEAGVLALDRSWRCYRRKHQIVFIDRFTNTDDKRFLSGFLTEVVINLYRAQTTWAVFFRIAPGTPSVGFYTDPTGVKEFLRFRDREDGSSRRSALAHWVTTHWRQNRHDPDVEVYVREHLRGKRSCVWHGMNAWIEVPEVDLQRVEEAVETRKRLSAAQLTRRLRDYRKRP